MKFHTDLYLTDFCSFYESKFVYIQGENSVKIFHQIQSSLCQEPLDQCVFGAGV